jgi:hypothetical protein
MRETNDPQRRQEANGTWKSFSREPDMSENAFRDYIDSLCYLCDSSRGETTTTAMNIVFHDGKIHYYLASPGRSASELQEARKYVAKIVHDIGKGSTRFATGKDLFHGVLERLVKHCRPRIEAYMATLHTSTHRFMDECES